MWSDFYVDEIFIALKCESHGNILLIYIKSIHSNIKFECKIEKDKSVVFLEISVH